MNLRTPTPTHLLIPYLLLVLVAVQLGTGGHPFNHLFNPRGHVGSASYEYDGSSWVSVSGVRLPCQNKGAAQKTRGILWRGLKGLGQRLPRTRRRASLRRNQVIAAATSTCDHCYPLMTVCPTLSSCLNVKLETSRRSINRLLSRKWVFIIYDITLAVATHRSPLVPASDSLLRVPPLRPCVALAALSLGLGVLVGDLLSETAWFFASFWSPIIASTCQGLFQNSSNGFLIPDLSGSRSA